jgi:hypothetical protein
MNTKSAGVDESLWNAGEDDLRWREPEHVNQVYAKAVEALFTTEYKVTDAEYAELRATIRAARLKSETDRLRLR